MYPDLCIILVNWNLKHDTLECIDSLINAGASLDQIILVDNGSTDGSLELIKRSYQDSIHTIDTKRNLGYAAGANLGISYALSQTYKWLLLLNNDTVVTTDFLAEMQKATATCDEYSILTPLILYHSKPSTIWFLGGQSIARSLLSRDKYNNQHLDQNFPLYIPIDFPSGCAMMVHRKVFEKIGMFDPSLFMYGEEVDFCWRAKAEGFRFACYPTAHIFHKVSKSSRNNIPKARYLMIRNQIYFYNRYSKGMHKFFYFSYTFFRTFFMVMMDILRMKTKLILPTIQGWLDGWLKPQIKKMVN